MHLLHRRVEAVDQIARGSQTLAGFENGFGIEGVTFGSFVERIDDMRVGDDREVEIASAGLCRQSLAESVAGSANAALPASLPKSLLVIFSREG